MQDMTDTARSAQHASSRGKIKSVILAMPRRIHSHVSQRTTSELYGVAKTTIVILAGVLPTLIAFVIVLQAILRNDLRLICMSR